MTIPTGLVKRATLTIEQTCPVDLVGFAPPLPSLVDLDLRDKTRLRILC